MNDKYGIKILTDEVLSHNSEKLDEIYFACKQAADRYWTAWKARNDIEVGHGRSERALGRYAPQVYRHSENGKIYLDWRDWAPFKAMKRQNPYAVRVKPSVKGEYPKGLFKGAQDWELLMIADIEEMFKPYRALIDVLHSSNVSIGRMRKKYKDVIDDFVS